MNKLWRVAVYEYRRNVFKKSFFITLLSIPCFIIPSVVLGLFLESRQDIAQPAGYVDHAGVLNEALFSPELQSRLAREGDKVVEFIAFPTEADARTALEAGKLQAYFILPENYLMTRKAEVVYIQEPGENTWRQFYDFLQVNLLAGKPQETIMRAAGGARFIVRSIDGRRKIPADSGPTFGLLMPFFITMAFAAMLLMSSGYTMSAVADEKENRTLEVLITTISPLQFVAGKILGIVAIGLTLLLTWTVVVGLGIIVGKLADLGWLEDLSMDWRIVTAALSIALPAYVLATALMVAIGAAVSTTDEGQSVSGIFIALHLIPMYISYLFLKDPHSSLAVLLTILPFTALLTVGMRNLFTIIPIWQVLFSVIVQMICALGAIWLASRAFRYEMLRYGQKLSFRRLLKNI